MERHFDEELAALKNLLIDMCEIAEEMVNMAIRILVDRDEKSIQSLTDRELRIDQRQVEIDEFACRLIALHQPTASDLRFLLGAAKINNEIERIADQATSIGGFAKSLLQEPPLKPFETIPEMVKIAVEMMHESIHAFVNFDTQRARQVILKDDTLDALNKEVISELVGFMKNNQEVLERALRLIFVAKKLERIGDLACNIAEDVVFMAEGKDLRHREDIQP